ncbi:glycosyltransferase family 21 protein [Phlegmacium glaucopus]|nr:glycosyltransferase family 21 protein [Phlegmacium glaucopus]
MDRNVIAHGLALVGSVWYLAMWSISILGCVAAPLKGLDTNLYENLESTFNQEYPNYEIIFSVADERDQALPVVQALIPRYPDVKVTVIIGEEVVGVNPKVNNLMRSFRAATHDILWVLDSGVMVDPGTLRRSVDILTTLPSSSRAPRSIALVHHVPLAVVNEPHIGSRLEAAFLNTNHAKMYIAINTISIESCVVGKSNLYRRSDTDRLNASLIPIRLQTATLEPREHGLRAFGKYLAEDNMIASAIWHELGLRHDLSCDVARNIIGNMSFSDYVWRRVRWIRVRKHMVLAATLLEPFTESVALSIIGSLSGRFLLNIPISLFTVLHFVLWLSLDLDVYASIASNTEVDAAFILAWAAREILAFPIWLWAIFGDEVVWRGQKYKVLKNGEAMLCTSQTGSKFGHWLSSLSRPQQYHQI